MKRNTTKKTGKPDVSEIWEHIKQRVAHSFSACRIGFGKLPSIARKSIVIGSGILTISLAGIIAFTGLVPTAAPPSNDQDYLQNSGMQIPEYSGNDKIDSLGDRHTIIMNNLLERDDMYVISVTMDDHSPLEYGMTDERVETLQIALIELGYLSIDETTQYYGPATKSAVMKFQRQHEQYDLIETGNADKRTLDMLFSGNSRPYALSVGDEGADVREIQLQLMDLAYMDKATGYYGDQTVAAVKDFQERNSLEVTGIADRKTMDLLYEPDAVEGQNYAVKTRRRAKILTFVDLAEQQLGKRYSLGSTGPNYFDCSGLVYYCLRNAGSNRRRLSADGYSKVTDWEKIESMSDLEIGDLLFYHIDSRTRIGHVGIYVGGGMMIDASFSRGRIVKRSCRTDYWLKRFAFARRPW